MIRGLIEKELRQHGMALLFLLLMIVAGVAVILQNKVLGRVFGTPLAAVQMLHWTFVPLACLLLGQALVASEYRDRTQLFLEGLPLPRWLTVAVKYAIGLLLVMVGVGAVLAVAWWRSRGSDSVTPRFLWLLILKSATYGWFMYSLCFAHGFMGRYRLVAAVAALAVIQADVVIAGIDVGRYGPFELVGHRFAYERHVIPWVPLLVTAGMAIFWMGAALALALARDATLAASLAERMSSREKIILTFCSFACILAIAYHAERSERGLPIHVPGAVEASRGVARVSGSAAVDRPTPSEQVAVERAVNAVAEELGSVAGYLRCRTMPQVFLVHRRDLKAGVFEDGEIEPAQGLMVRVNLTAEGFSEEALSRWVVREALVAKSFGRLTLEPCAWVLDGFAAWWPTRAAGPGEDAGEIRLARAAMPDGFSGADVARWLSLRARAGDSGARALAACGLRVLGQSHGEAARRDFLAAVLGREVKKDARAWLRDVLEPVPRRFRAATGATLDGFVAEWRGWIAGARP